MELHHTSYIQIMVPKIFPFADSVIIMTIDIHLTQEISWCQCNVFLYTSSSFLSNCWSGNFFRDQVVEPGTGQDEWMWNCFQILCAQLHSVSWWNCDSLLMAMAQGRPFIALCCLVPCFGLVGEDKIVYTWHHAKSYAWTTGAQMNLSRIYKLIGCLPRISND